MIGSRLLKLRLTRLHYEHAPKSIKDKHLPVLVGMELTKPALEHKPVEYILPIFEDKGAPLKIIIETVAMDFGVPSWKLLGDSRTWDVTVPRHVAMYLATRFSRLSYGSIGRCFRKDHTVIFHAEKKIGRVILEDERMNRRVQALRCRLASNPNIPSYETIAQHRHEASVKARRGRETASCA